MIFTCKVIKHTLHVSNKLNLCKDRYCYYFGKFSEIKVMQSWASFVKDEKEYDLSHLDQLSFEFTREEGQKLKILLNFSHHCFTGHVGEDEWIYPHASDERYFCETRYNLSKNLPAFMRSLLDTNPYFLRTFAEHREQFFYLENEFHGETYRLFIEISCPTKNYADVRIDIRSAYHEEAYALPVSGNTWFKLWRVIDAKLSGDSLPKNKTRGRARRR